MFEDYDNHALNFLAGPESGWSTRMQIHPNPWYPNKTPPAYTQALLVSWLGDTRNCWPCFQNGRRRLFIGRPTQRLSFQRLQWVRTWMKSLVTWLPWKAVLINAMGASWMSVQGVCFLVRCLWWGRTKNSFQNSSREWKLDVQHYRMYARSALDINKLENQQPRLDSRAMGQLLPNFEKSALLNLTLQATLIRTER